MARIKQITPEQFVLLLHLFRIQLYAYIMFPEYIQQCDINKNISESPK